MKLKSKNVREKLEIAVLRLGIIEKMREERDKNDNKHRFLDLLYYIIHINKILMKLIKPGIFLSLSHSLSRFNKLAPLHPN